MICVPGKALIWPPVAGKSGAKLRVKGPALWNGNRNGTLPARSPVCGEEEES